MSKLPRMLLSESISDTKDVRIGWDCAVFFSDDRFRFPANNCFSVSAIRLKVEDFILGLPIDPLLAREIYLAHAFGECMFAIGNINCRRVSPLSDLFRDDGVLLTKQLIIPSMSVFALRVFWSVKDHYLIRAAQGNSETRLRITAHLDGDLQTPYVG